jgi:hypothetical protein
MTLRWRIVVFALAAPFALTACDGSGTSTAPPASPTPAATAVPGTLALSGSLAFGDVMVGRWDSAALTLRNTGTGPVAVRGIRFSGVSGSVFSSDFAATVIASGEARSATVRFAPAEAMAYEGTLTVDSDASGGSSVVPLSGTGRAGVTIAFSGLLTSESPAGTYAESGFVVTADSSDWITWTAYGAPAPCIVFFAHGGALTRGVSVTASGSTFKFVAVDLYSSMTPIPYEITGLRDSVVVFSVAGTWPNTFGNFRTVEHPNGRENVDTLLIRLSNPAPADGSNPMGLDNIVLMK